MPPDPARCMRCNQLVILHNTGALRLCTACTTAGLAPVCADYDHMYVGAPTPAAAWVCLWCGVLLISQDISTAEVPAAVPDRGDF